MKALYLVAAAVLLGACAPATPTAPQGGAEASPSPSVMPSPSAVKIKIKAAVIKGSGEIVPAARTMLLIAPYNLAQVKADLAVKNAAGPKPDGNAKELKRSCPEDADWTLCLTDEEKLADAIDAWEKVAYAGLDEAIKEASNGLTTKSLTTDFDGEAEVELTPGMWYVTGHYALLQGKSNVYWIGTPMKVEEGMTKFELSNDNGEVINL